MSKKKRKSKNYNKQKNISVKSKKRQNKKKLNAKEKKKKIEMDNSPIKAVVKEAIEETTKGENIKKQEDKKETNKKIKKEKVKKKHNKTKVKKNLQKINKKKVIVIMLSSIFILAIAIALIWYLVNVTFAIKSEIQVEVGTQTELNPQSFLNSYAKGEVKLLTDTTNFDFNKISDQEVELEYNEKTYHSKVHFVDTTPPQVEFKNVNAYIDYVFNAEDFIESKTDVTEMTVEIVEKPEDISKYQEYPVVVVVRDEGGNETRGDVILNTSFIKSEFVLEYGNLLTYEDLFANPEADKHLLPQSELDRINSSPVGEYEIKTVNQEQEFITKIIIKDTMAPNLVLRDVEIYNDETTLAKEQFIQSVTDASEFTTELKTQIPFTQIGTYDIQIEAKDIYGNTVTQAAKLTIKKDTVGPVISGLSNLSVGKNSAVDWNRGVSARDQKDGSCEFTVDTSAVNLAVAGTYNATYTSKDKTGNTTKKTRKVTVNPDATDVSNKASEWLAKSGRDPISIKNYVANTIKYSTATNRSTIWGAWMGFTTLRGDCYVHAAATHMLLQKAGYSCMIVNATDNGHFWNLVNVGGSWKHIDSTPPRYSQNGYMNDDQRAATLNGRDWNRAAFPKAE